MLMAAGPGWEQVLIHIVHLFLQVSGRWSAAPSIKPGFFLAQTKNIPPSKLSTDIELLFNRLWEQRNGLRGANISLIFLSKICCIIWWENKSEIWFVWIELYGWETMKRPTGRVSPLKKQDECLLALLPLPCLYWNNL